MLNLAAAAVLVRDLTHEQLAGATHRDRSPAPRRAAAPTVAPAPGARRAWILRVASLVTQRSTEETWPRRKSRTSAC
jgi:hypothetical protein